ncbi:CysN GTPases - Sulfate adenylate transferase subunit 1 [actinobacterium SCGC AAA044-D11]|jgi:bifunctional enzyme CysN/CysC
MATPKVKPVIRLLTCGSVDDGKSTLIGRLLVETDSIPHDTVATARSVRRGGSTIAAGEIDFSLLTDGLEAEREQGITIDVAYRSMTLLNGSRLIIADAPGHEQYTRNMAVAASRSDVALVLLDAARGVRPQTLRHLTICALMGVSRVAIVINKLDMFDYSKEKFAEISAQIAPAVARLNLNEHAIIPVSALVGDNVVFKGENMNWYTGPTLLEYIQNQDLAEDSMTSPHFGIQYISRVDTFRGLAGTLVNGKFNLGDEVVILPSKKRATISKMVTFDGELATAGHEQTLNIVLEPEVDAARGDVLHLASNAKQPADRFTANIVWLGESDLIHSRSYILISGSTSTPAIVTTIKHKVNIESGEHDSARTLKMNEIGVIEIATDSPIALSNYSDSRETGNFILVDRATLNTVGAGMVVHALRRSENVTEQAYEIDGEKRAAQKGQVGKVLWFTGLSGSGKSTIANEVAKELYALGRHVYVLDGDNLRLGLNKDLGFAKEDRAENVRRVSEVAKLMMDAGLIVIVALVSPFRVDRDQARELFAKGKFIEVWVNTPAELCAQRDPKGLYKKAAAGDLPNMTGIGQEYEAPLNAEVELDGTLELKVNTDIILEIAK